MNASFHSHSCGRRAAAFRAALGLAFAILMGLAAAQAEAAITRVGATVGTVARTVDQTITVPGPPAGVVSNDALLLVLSISGVDVTAISAPSGWALVNRTSGTNHGQAVFRKLAGAAEAGPYAFTWTHVGTPGGNDRALAYILAYRGVDTTSPINAVGGQYNPVSSSSVTAPSIVTSVADTLLVGFFGLSNNVGGGTLPVSMGNSYSQNTGGGGGGTTVLSGDQPWPSIGATGSRTATFGSATVSVGHLLALRPAAVTAVDPAGFNAFETFTAAGSIAGVIRTKVAASAFALDVVALNTAGTAVETAFAGDVRAELVDASGGGACVGLPLVRSLGTLSFVAGDAGRKTLAGINEPNAWPNVRVRLSYPASGTPTVVACSTDPFAIRPASFGSVIVSDADSLTAGTARTLANTAASGGVVHRAGRPFRIAATALNTTGAVTANYAGSPVASLTACVLPAAGCAPGTLSGGAWSAAAGTAVTLTASYSEVGAFAMRLVDTGFAAVDAADGSTAAEMNIESAVINVGRFVPDHFELTPASTPQFKTFNDTACATRSFTYVGQPFGYVVLPQAAIAAKNAAGATTLNYAGALWKLEAAGATQTYTAASGTLDSGLVGTPLVAASGGGTGSLSADTADVVAFARSTPVAPFAAAITLSMSIRDEAETGVAGNGVIDTAAPAVFSAIAFDAGDEIRFGRLALTNAHGSELLGLPVPIEAQFWNGSGFVRNPADACTQLAASQVALSGWRRNLAPCETSTTLSGRFVGGRGNLRLSAPGVDNAGVANTGSVDLTVQLGVTASGSACVAGTPTPAVGASNAWLQGAWSGGAHDQNPAARASFGLYRGSKTLIYQREMY